MPDAYSRLVDQSQYFGGSICCVGDRMPSDPRQCLAEATCYLELARRAKTLEGRQTFEFLADRWKGLAADLEKAEASLERLNENGIRRAATYPYD